MDAVRLIEKYADMVYRLALLEMKNTNDADDLFQEVFLRFIKNQQKIENEEHAKAWLIKVTLNCAKKHYTNFWKKNVVPVERETFEEMTVSEDNLMQAFPEESEIYQTVKALPVKYYRVIHLFYFEELSVREISNLLNEKESTVKSQLFRGRELLGERLRRDF